MSSIHFLEFIRPLIVLRISLSFFKIQSVPLRRSVNLTQKVQKVTRTKFTLPAWLICTYKLIFKSREYSRLLPVPYSLAG